MKSRYCWLCGATKPESEFHRDRSQRDGFKLRCKPCSKVVTGKPRNLRHGRTDSREYSSWTNAKTRCFNPASDAYPRYGGRGITMCAEWAADFSAFYRDMGPCPTGLTLERRDVNGDYGPDNCYWASYQQQNNNRRNNKRITFGGFTRTLAEWDRALGLKLGMLSTRLRLGVSLEHALQPGRLRGNGR